MLQQAVLSYIAAGWPREDIIIVDNSGTMDANPEGLLSRDNPFFLDYQLFRSHYGVSILQTPTLFSFAQLMNFYLRLSIAQQWPFFFWSHMDVVVLSNEIRAPYKSLYQEILESLSTDTPSLSDPVNSTWAVKFFAYDFLTLINVSAWRTIGQWDTFIPYYTTDCDAYSRVVMNGFSKEKVELGGRIYDVASTMHDPEAALFPATDQINSEQAGSQRYQELVTELDRMEREKRNRPANEGGRNTWQDDKGAGRGEPWTYDPPAFQHAWLKTSDNGREMYKDKWGTSLCNLEKDDVQLSGMWSIEHTE
ncbi:hypothetical protein DBV05_g10723 [Lasiodiplodia theobromae]|uniref:Uncharacterized protein n=1 Tax=Lasiodiplodia theobromae TaxID=45133 RepID=A0A5N5CZ57_9PEZI|nr:hypothetical protein DBV05_g10723 [Lasiodiplodia theobromae]